MVNLRSELDVFQYVYSPLLQQLYHMPENPPDHTSSSATSTSPSSLSPSSSSLVIEEEVLTQCSIYTEQCLSKVLSWIPKHSTTMRLEQLRMLQYQYPLLRARRQYLGPVLSMLFTGNVRNDDVDDDHDVKEWLR